MVQTNNVRNISAEEAKAILSGVVEMCIHTGKYDLSSHSEVWNFLVKNKALFITDDEYTDR